MPAKQNRGGYVLLCTFFDKAQLCSEVCSCGGISHACCLRCDLANQVPEHTCLQHLPVQGDGPIALVMVPTRELVVQIGKDIKRFARSANSCCVCVYGGTGVGSQVTSMCSIQLRSACKSKLAALTGTQQTVIHASQLTCAPLRPPLLMLSYT